MVASPAPQSTGPGGVAVECPAANNTFIDVPGTTQRFYRTCNTDYNGNLGSVDIAHFVVGSFVECMQTCVAFNSLGNTTTSCTGVSWRWEGLPGTDYNFCYLKSGLGTLIPLVDVEAASLQ
jgi:hypothetical protein